MPLQHHCIMKNSALFYSFFLFMLLSTFSEILVIFFPLFKKKSDFLFILLCVWVLPSYPIFLPPCWYQWRSREMGIDLPSHIYAFVLSHTFKGREYKGSRGKNRDFNETAQLIISATPHMTYLYKDWESILWVL